MHTRSARYAGSVTCPALSSATIRGIVPSLDALDQAYRNGLRYVVVSQGVNAPVSKPFADAGWKVQPLGSYWQLAVAPRAGRAAVCRAE